jgi:lysophospholipid hydrolase
MQLAFPTASERLHTAFYRSKVTSWMAQQEEDFRFILLETDAQASPWSQLCVSQADCVLLTANAEAHPTATSMEEELIVRVGSKVRCGGNRS